jgi:hypothetical protein
VFGAMPVWRFVVYTEDYLLGEPTSHSCWPVVVIPRPVHGASLVGAKGGRDGLFRASS